MKTKVTDRRPPQQWQQFLYELACKVVFENYSQRLRKRLDKFYHTNVSLHMNKLRDNCMGWVGFFRFCEALEIDVLIDLDYDRQAA